MIATELQERCASTVHAFNFVENSNACAYGLDSLCLSTKDKLIYSFDRTRLNTVERKKKKTPTKLE